MKKNLFQLSLLLSLYAAALCGCTEDDAPVAVTDGTTLTIRATAGDFASAGGAGTRASESGYATTFTAGDAIGVFAVKNGAVIAGCRNVKCTYDATTQTWTADATAPVYNYSGAEYFAYYPYKDEMNGKTSVDEITEAFKTTVATATDQGTYALYTACNLMTTSQNAQPGSDKTLRFSFTHQMSLIEIALPVLKYKTSNDADAYEYSSPVLGATFSITPSSGSASSITPCYMGNGVYRYIVPAGTYAVSGEFTADNQTIQYNRDAFALSAGKYKRLNVTYNGASTPSVRALAAGDFYYSDGSICPGNADNPPKEGCIGIVYWLGNITGDNYGLLDTQFPKGTHGLVVSLWDMPAPDNANSIAMKWTYGGYEYVNNWLANATWSGSVSRPANFTSIQVTDKMQGYANTLALEEYNKYVESQTAENGYGPQGDKRVKPIKGLADFQTAHPAPSNSSGWYWPSVKELRHVCWGQNNTSQSTAGKNMLNTQIERKLNGTGNTFPNGYGDIHWSSTEDSDSDGCALIVYFRNGEVSANGIKYHDAGRVRPLLAF